MHTYRVVAAGLVVVGALALSACGGSDDMSSESGDSDTETTAPAGDGVETDMVSIKDFMFDPGGVTVAKGTTVTWTNGDDFAHSVVADDDSFMSEDLDQGATFSQTFDKAGEFSYICGIHNSMTGTVTVTG
jgi:plastocyanin